MIMIYYEKKEFSFIKKFKFISKNNKIFYIINNINKFKFIFKY